MCDGSPESSDDQHNVLSLTECDSDDDSLQSYFAKNGKFDVKDPSTGPADISWTTETCKFVQISTFSSLHT